MIRILCRFSCSYAIAVKVTQISRKVQMMAAPNMMTNKERLSKLPNLSKKRVQHSSIDRRQRFLSSAREAVETMRSTLPKESYVFNFETISEDNLIQKDEEDEEEREEDDEKEEIEHQDERHRASTFSKQSYTIKHNSSNDVNLLKKILERGDAKNTIAKINEDYAEMKKMHHLAVATYDENMKNSKIKRTILDANQKRFEEQKLNFRKYILENVKKINQQRQDFIENRQKVMDYRNVMLDLVAQTQKLRERKNYLEEKIAKLRPTEKFFLNAIDLLPSNYISKSANPIRSLMLRYKGLLYASKLLSDDFNSSQTMMESIWHDQNMTNAQALNYIIVKSNAIHECHLEVETLSEQVHEQEENMERYKDNICSELQLFFVITRAIRNITTKSKQLLKDVQYTTFIVKDPATASLSESLRLVTFLFNVIFNIQRELVSTTSSKINKKDKKPYSFSLSGSFLPPI